MRDAADRQPVTGGTYAKRPSVFTSLDGVDTFRLCVSMKAGGRAQASPTGRCTVPATFPEILFGLSTKPSLDARSRARSSRFNSSRMCTPWRVSR